VLCKDVEFGEEFHKAIEDVAVGDLVLGGRFSITDDSSKLYSKSVYK